MAGWPCTDGYRLHACKDLAVKDCRLPNGNYNPDALYQCPEDYPDYSKIVFNDPECEVYNDTIEVLKANFMACGITDIKLNAVNFLETRLNKKYVEQAINFLEHFISLTGCTTVKVLKKDNTKPLIINVYDNNEVVAYALIMPIRD